LKFSGDGESDRIPPIHGKSIEREDTMPKTNEELVPEFSEKLQEYFESIGRLVNDPDYNNIPREIRVRYGTEWMFKIVKNQATAQAWVKYFQRKFNLSPYDFSWVEIIVRTDLRKVD